MSQPHYWEKWLREIRLKPIDNDMVISSENDEIAYALDADSYNQCCCGDENPEEALLQADATPMTLGFETMYDLYCGYDKVNTYLADKTLNAAYRHGNHAPEGKDFASECRFKSGDKELAYFDWLEVIVPCVIIGPLTREYLQNHPESMMDERCMDDWDWDSVIVLPLVRLKFEDDIVAALDVVKRVHIFPHKSYLSDRTLH